MMGLTRWLQRRSDRKLYKFMLESYQRRWLAEEMAREHRIRLAALVQEQRSKVEPD